MPGDRDPKGLYATLGVATDAGEAEIRKAYRRLALRWHPDKNPDNQDATAEFQKISAAYEVLIDEERRSMYDTTGCIDADELDEGGVDHAANLFAAFFSGGFSEDLDADEQAMLDEFLFMTGGMGFKTKGSRKKGRGIKAKRAAKLQEQMLEEALAAAMGGVTAPEPTCPTGHPLKKKKADGGYECDLCSSDIVEGKRFYDCRKCDFSMCSKCYKREEAKALADAEEIDDEAEVFEAFCEQHIHPVREGGKLRFRCGLCEKLSDSEEQAAMHMANKHAHEIQAVAAQIQGEGLGGASSGGYDRMPPGMMSMESMFMDAMMDGMMGGMGGGMASGAPKVAGARGSRRKR